MIHSDTIELHLTYHCNLACRYCNRCCGLGVSHTPDMEWPEIRRALYGSGQSWKRIVLIGGEPTLHPNVIPVARECRSAFPEARVVIVSNEHTEESRRIVATLEDLGVQRHSQDRKEASVLHVCRDMYLSRSDLRILRDGDCDCDWRAADCGFSADAFGITACSCGGAIDGILGLGVRTWDWAEVKNPDRLRRLCEHCGHGIQTGPIPPAALHDYRGQSMTRTWFARMPQPMSITAATD